MLLMPRSVSATTPLQPFEGGPAPVTARGYRRSRESVRAARRAFSKGASAIRRSRAICRAADVGVALCAGFTAVDDSNGTFCSGVTWIRIEESPWVAEMAQRIAPALQSSDGCVHAASWDCPDSSCGIQ